jgi:gas vesicle protein
MWFIIGLFIGAVVGFACGFLFFRNNAPKIQATEAALTAAGTAVKDVVK